MRRLLTACALIALLLSGCGTLGGRSDSPPRAVRLALQPLRPLASNPRYFTDGSGRAVYLTGFHTWSDLVDRGRARPPARFDYGAYLDRLGAYGDNLIRLWAWELPEYVSHDETWFTDPQPWLRTGPGEARDGLPRFDLTRLDRRYFDRLRQRVRAADRRGIYVSVMLFEGWETHTAQRPLGWQAHPFAGGNNVNGIAVDKDGRGLRFFSGTDPRVLALQREYVRRVVDAVGRLPNVLFEISNEADAGANLWQLGMIRFLRHELAARGVRRPVGMTFEHGGSNERLYAGPADWVSPGGRVFLSDPPLADRRKVSLLDTDHLCGVCGDADFVWQAFTRGYNVLYMDDLGDAPAHERARVALGQARAVADAVDLARLEPSTERCSTRYCLVGPQYVVYQPGEGSFTLDLPRRRHRYRLDWLSTGTGKTASGRIRAAGTTTLTPPFAGPAVVRVSG
jgi:Family of unknown function (DUF6298)